MALYLKNKKRHKLLEVYVTLNDDCVEVCSLVNIGAYSELLLQHENKELCISDFWFLSELSKWFLENYCEKVTKVVWEDVVEDVKEILIEIGDRHGLHLTEG